MSGIAVRKIARADAATIDRLGKQGVATVHEAQGKAGLMATYMRPIYRGVAAAGSAVTVLVPPGDNWMIHVAVELCQPGDIMVVGTMAPSSDGYFGELLATSLMARGVRALVIDAGCRDVRALELLGFPVWSKAVSARGTVKETLGAVNVPIVCAGVVVHAGDVVVADDDGVVVIPRGRAMSIAAAGAKREADEDAKRARFKAGEFGLDIYGMREKLAAKGLLYVDDPEDIPGE